MDKQMAKVRIDVLRPTITIEGVKYINKRDYDHMVQRGQWLLKEARQQTKGLQRRKHQLRWDNVFKHKLYHKNLDLYEEIMEEMRTLPPAAMKKDCHVCNNARSHLKKNRT